MRSQGSAQRSMARKLHGWYERDIPDRLDLKQMEAEQTVERKISSLQPGEHLCCFSREAQSYLEVRLRYLSAGLELGQKLLYLYHDSSPHCLLAAFEMAGLPARAAHARGQLVLAPVGEIYPSAASAGLVEVPLNGRAAAGTGLEEQPVHRRAAAGTGLEEQPVHRRAAAGTDPEEQPLLRRAAAGTDPHEFPLLRRADPELDPQETLRRLNAAAELALAEGYPALRVATEMSWTSSLRHGSPAADQILRCEALLSLPGSLANTLLLCLYDRHSADASFLLGVMTAHPTLLEQGQVYPNPFCLPAEVFLPAQDGASQHGTAMLDMHLYAIANARATGSANPGQPAQAGPNAAHGAGHNGGSLSLDLLREGSQDALNSMHAALRESENRYRTIFDAATEAIFIHDLHGCFLEVNRVACDRLGYSMQELLCKKSDFIDAPELAGQSALRLSLLREYGEISYETVHCSRSGELYPVEVNARLIEYAGRQVVLNIARDISDRKRAELSIVNANQALAEANEALEASNQALEVSNEALEASNAALRESEHKFRSLVKSSPNGIALINENGQFLEFNPANEAIYGIPAERALGMRVTDFFIETLPPEQRQAALSEQISSAIQAPLVSGQADWLYKVHDREILSFDGRRRFLQTTGFPIRTERGYMIGLITRDVTAHRLAEMELEEYRQRLEGMVAERTEQLRHEIRERQQVEQNLEVMLREIHHRVKNNLNVVIALIDMQKGAHTDPAVVETFKELQTRAYSMALVHESLYRSPNLAHVDFTVYLQNLMDYLQSAYGARAVRMPVEAYDVALPIETAIPCGLIVNELVTNALKYAFPAAAPGQGWHDCQVLVRLEHGQAEEGSYILSVADNGIGLPQAMDWQSSSTLGLQLARVLARQLGGQLELLPVPGTCWRLEFMERR